jgi:cytochrome oxidase Cu insertion factor (SCO1/SenC/PrrC family)
MKEKQQRGKPRVTLIVMVVVFAAPVVLAWWLYAVVQWRPADTVNHGVLVEPPRRLDTAYRLSTPAGTVMQPDYLQGKWTLVTIGDSDCDPVCTGNFYKMRQVRLAQGEDMRRVQRLFLITTPEAELPGTLEEYPEMDVVLLPRSTQEEFLAPFLIDAAAPSAAGRVYLVDPLGNLMMYYNRDADPSGILKDLKRLLKISSVG